MFARRIIAALMGIANSRNSGHFAAQEVGVSDPLRPSAALPLTEGENSLVSPSVRGTARAALAASAGGRSHRLFRKAPVPGLHLSFPRLLPAPMRTNIHENRHLY